MLSDPLIAGSLVVVCPDCSKRNRVALGRVSRARCGRCGVAISRTGDLATVCPSCRLVTNSNVYAVDPRCSSCGASLRPCPKCGLRISEPEPPVVAFTTYTGDCVTVAAVCSDCYAAWLMQAGRGDEIEDDDGFVRDEPGSYMKPETYRLSEAEVEARERRDEGWSEWIEQFLRLRGLSKPLQ